MINRVLIRIKAIQILYSYLLVEKKFSLEGKPGAPTKETRFAYSLYLDLLLFMLRIAESIGKRGGDKPLEDTRFIKRIKSDEVVKSQMAKYKDEPFMFSGIVEPLADIVKESSIYKNFIKNRKDSEYGMDETVWNEIFNLIIMPNPEVLEIISRRQNYTLKGVDRTRGMMDVTFKNFMESHDNGAEALEAFHKSIEKARELYLRILYLPVELKNMQERALDERRHRYLVTNRDLNPNLRFVENVLVKEIEKSELLTSCIEGKKLEWVKKDPIMMDNILKSILDSDIYKDYMESTSNDIHSDCDFWRNILKKVIFTNEYFLESIENESVYWNDDLDIIGTFVLKSIRKFEEGEGEKSILDKFKDEEDARFGDELIMTVLKNKDLYKTYIDEAVDKKLWESERLAFMDVVIIETALAEILNFPKIPLTVSLNEYIEIAKSYSTVKSGGFVNGILSSILMRLQKDGVLEK